MTSFVLGLALVAGLSYPQSPQASETPCRAQATIDGEPLSLNGCGLREAAGFIKAYYAGLYLRDQDKTHNADEVLSAKGPKRIELLIEMNLDRGTILDKWLQSFNQNCSANCEMLRTILKDDFGAHLPSSVAEGDNVSLLFVGDRVDLEFNRQRKTRVTQPGFPEALLSVWFGANPLKELLSVRNGMLGRDE